MNLRPSYVEFFAARLLNLAAKVTEARLRKDAQSSMDLTHNINSPAIFWAATPM